MALSCALIAGMLAGVTWMSGSAFASAASPALQSPRLLGWGLNNPTATVTWGNDLFIANCPDFTDGYIVEVNADNGIGP